VTRIHHFRGGLSQVSASLLFVLSSEVLKWRFPVSAASEKISMLLAALRKLSFPLDFLLSQN
jgi:hypothetical protein